MTSTSAVPLKRRYSPDRVTNDNTYDDYSPRSPSVYEIDGPPAASNYTRTSSPMDRYPSQPLEHPNKRYRPSYDSSYHSPKTCTFNGVEATPIASRRTYYRDKFGRPYEDEPPFKAPAASTTLPTHLPSQVAASQEEVDEIIAEHIRLAIEDDHDWTCWHRSQAERQTVPQVLVQYRFAKKIMDQYVNRITPQDLAGAPNQRIRPVNDSLYGEIDFVLI
jgi:hypothetical protein